MIRRVIYSVVVGIILISWVVLAEAPKQQIQAEVIGGDITFLIFQLQTASVSSASSELVSIVNASAKPQRLDGICIDYSAATSNSWLERACIHDQDQYTQLWVVSGGSVFFTTSAYLSENPNFISDTTLSSSMAAGGGAIKLRQADTTLDILGWGTSNYSESDAITAPANNELLQRKIDENGLVDTENNADDFEFAEQNFVAVSGVFEVELPRDVCNNIDGMQESLPIGYEQVGDECYQDLCLNIDGIQATLSGYELTDLGVCKIVMLEDSELVVTELLPNVSGSDEGKEFIELYNPNAFSVALKGYRIVADSDEFVIPDGELDPGAYVAFYDSDSTITLPNTNGVAVIVIAPSGREVSRSIIYTNTPDDQSWNLVEGVWQYSNQLTPGAANKVSSSSTVAAATTDELEPCPTGKFRNPETNRCKTIETDNELVPCEAGEFRNPLTNRCNKSTATSSTLVPCGPDEFRNPETNRCKKLTSATSNLQPCDEGEERNPETNRCRKIATLASADTTSRALTAEIIDVPAPNTGVNWAIIVIAVFGSFTYVAYEWRSELTQTILRLKALGS